MQQKLYTSIDNHIISYKNNKNRINNNYSWHGTKTTQMAVANGSTIIYLIDEKLFDASATAWILETEQEESE